MSNVTQLKEQLHHLLELFLPPGAELTIHAPNDFQHTYRGRSENDDS